MGVSRPEILRRGLRLACPNCGHRTLFQPGRWLRPNRVCPQCGLEFDRDEGAFLGSMTINYGVVVFGAVGPLLLLGAHGVVESSTALGLAVAAGAVLPFAFYRPARSWWLMVYFLVLPQQLPANHPDPEPEEDDNR